MNVAFIVNAVIKRHLRITNFFVLQGPEIQYNWGKFRQSLGRLYWLDRQWALKRALAKERFVFFCKRPRLATTYLLYQTPCATSSIFLGQGSPESWHNFGTLKPCQRVIPDDVA